MDFPLRIFAAFFSSIVSHWKTLTKSLCVCAWNRFNPIHSIGKMFVAIMCTLLFIFAFHYADTDRRVLCKYLHSCIFTWRESRLFFILANKISLKQFRVNWIRIALRIGDPSESYAMQIGTTRWKWDWEEGREGAAQTEHTDVDYYICVCIAAYKTSKVLFKLNFSAKVWK